jgi:hypothetical protein
MRKTHLVGSVPLDSATTVMTEVAKQLSSYLDRIPDGETGHRLMWVGWQKERIAACPALTPSEQLDHYGTPRMFKLREGADPSQLSFETLGYADEAISSFQTFKKLQASGVIPAETKFQVNLPTALGITAAFFDLQTQPVAEPVIEQALLRDIHRIASEIDPRKLAIQWDVAIEFAVLKAGLPVWFDDADAGIVSRLVRLGNSVPQGIDLGFHLCFGDLGHKHFVEPESLQPLIAVANAVSDGISRPIKWFHMPVPRDRSDPAYFAPLVDYRATADLFLGLIHLTDGIEGAERRVAAARQFREDFGIATECGLGRRPPETIPSLLQLHKHACGCF